MMKMFDKVTDQIVAVIRELFKSSLDEGKTPGVSIHFFLLHPRDEAHIPPSSLS